MRITHYQSGEAPRPGLDPAFRHSFGRIAARRPVAPELIHPAGVRQTPETALTPDLRRLEAAAHANRARLLGEFVAAAWRGTAATARRVLGAWQRRRQGRATYLALRGLDDRALRDLGMDRSEILSVAMYSERDDGTRRLRGARAANSLQVF
jgi:uncharacterized protein YjiS (DUF1127 family)